MTSQAPPLQVEMMGILMFETCWAHKRWNKIASDIKLVFHSSTISSFFFATLRTRLKESPCMFLRGSFTSALPYIYTHKYQPEVFCLRVQNTAPNLEYYCRLKHSCASACKSSTTQNQPHQISNTQRTENKTTDVVSHQHSRKLLMMDILMSETCSAHKKWNKISSDIKLVFHSSTRYTLLCYWL